MRVRKRKRVCFVGKTCILFFITKVFMLELLISALVFTFVTCQTSIK